MRKVMNSVVIVVSIFVAPLAALSAEYVKCEATSDSRKYCNIRDAEDSNIELDRQLSKSSCIEGRSWGVDRRGVWVEDGCRAEFRVERRYGGRYSSDKRELELEREKLALEKERLELEKMKNQKSNQAANKGTCPRGSRPGRCSDKQRRKGCKDFRTPTGLGCFTG